MGKEVEEKVGEALKENFVQLEKKVETETEAARKEETSEGEKDENADAKQKDDDDEGMDEGDESQEESSNEQMETDKVVDGEKGTASKEDDEKTEGKDGEEEPSNLQLAWEMLELAKVIYTKVVNTWPKADDTTIKPYEEKLHRTILTLGEISIENENYSQAVEDIQMCLKEEGAFKKDSRLVAETHYQLGVAQGFNSQYDAAVESLNSAIQIIKERIKNIDVLMKSSEDKKESGELEVSIYKKEIEELEALIPEIEEKITDTRELKKEAEAKAQDPEKTSSEAKAAGDVKSASTIAVKRKAEVDESQSKKSNSDEKTAAAV